MENKKEKSKNKMTIYQKLLEFQKQVETVEKSKENPYYKSKYADVNDYLKAVKPILNKLGLVIIQPLDGDKLITQIIDTETGEKIESSVILPTNPDPQKQGSIITYFRRYSIQSLLSLEAEDDDANSAVQGTQDRITKIKKMISQSINVDGLIEYAEKIKQTNELNDEQRKEIDKVIKDRIDQLTV